VAHRQGLEKQLSEAEKALVIAVKAIADRREGPGHAHRTGQRGPDPATAAEEEIARHAVACNEALERAEWAEVEYAEAREESAGLDDEDADLVARTTRRPRGSRRPGPGARELGDAERTAEREASEWAAREEALGLGLRRKDGAGALLAAGDRIPGLLGSVAALLAVEPGHEPHWPPRWAIWPTRWRCPGGRRRRGGNACSRPTMPGGPRCW